MSDVLEFDYGDNGNEKIPTKTTVSSVRKKSIFDGCSAYITCDNAQKLQKTLLLKLKIFEYAKHSNESDFFKLYDFFINYEKYKEQLNLIDNKIKKSFEHKASIYNFLFNYLDIIESISKTSLITIYGNYPNILSIISELKENKEYKNYIKLKSELNLSNNILIANNYIPYNIEVQIRNITQFLYKGYITDIDFEKKTFKIKLKSTTSSIVQNFFSKFPIKFANLCITDNNYNSQDGKCNLTANNPTEMIEMN